MRKQYLSFTRNIFQNIIRIEKRSCYFKFKTIITSIIVAASFCSRAPDKPGLKIVSLSPAMTEILFAIGAETNLVGVTTFCDYPEQAKQIYKVGDFSHPSIERIIGLKPNMVIVNLPEQMRIKQQLDNLKINVFVSTPKSLSDLYSEIIEIGKIVNREERADSLVHYMQTHIKHCTDKRLKRVYIELSPRPLVTVGQTSFLNELLERAGGENIFSDLQKDY
ncbi:MAG: ABC transporter substrate-binding protein, partial [candidate division WOR-3 bacterium]